MTFTQNIKQEILSKKMDYHEFLTFLKGIINSIAKKENPHWLMKISNDNIIDFILLKITEHNLNKFIQINGHYLKVDTKLLKDIKFADDPWIFFAGIFVVSGSINSPNSSNYHFEVKLQIKMTTTWVKFLKTENLTPVVYKKGSFNVLYWKKAEYISDFLKLIGTFESFMAFEEKRIQRDFNNNLNRIVNFEFFNQEKISNASVFLLDAIEHIESMGLLHLFSEKEILFMELKKAEPYESLANLVLTLKNHNVNISKSGLNHWVRKIKKISNFGDVNNKSHN